MPVHGGESQDALQDPDRDPGTGAAAVALQVQLALEGLVDRFDQPQRLEQLGAGCSVSPLRAGRNSRTPSSPSIRWNWRP